MNNLKCFASCSFGLESTVAAELNALGFETRAEDARGYFNSDALGIARANIHLSTADRVYIVLGEFRAVTFDELFNGIKSINFSDFLTKRIGYSVHLKKGGRRIAKAKLRSIILPRGRRDRQYLCEHTAG